MKPSSNSAPNLRVTEGLKERALSVADRLLKALELLGCDVQWRGNMTVETPDGTLKISLQEEIDSIERPPTADEKQRYWWSDHKFYQEMPSGRLTVQIETYVYRVTADRAWRDEKGRLLEKRIDEIATGITHYAKEMAIELRRQEVERQRWKEEQAQRERAEVARRLEARRLERLTADLSDCKKAAEVRTFVEQYEQAFVDQNGPIGKDSEVAEWIQWMKDYARRIDPLMNLKDSEP